MRASETNRYGLRGGNGGIKVKLNQQRVDRQLSL
jgi:hypothetical protein